MRHLANAIVFVSVLVSVLPSLVPLLRRAIVLAPLTVEERRARLMGDFYTSLQTIPRDRPVAILLLGRDALDRGVFVNYFLYPTPARVHQDRLPTHAPASVVAVAREGPVRRTVVAHPRPSTLIEGEAFVPFVASVFGADSYATEGVIEGAGDASVTLTLMPFGATKTVTGRHVFSDVVQELLGRRETGWLRIRATKPVRAGFWLVARADAIATPIPLFTHVPPSPQTIRGGERLWLLNTSANAVTPRVNGREESLPPFVLRAVRAEPVNVVEGEAFAFTSARMSFTWSTP